MPEWMSGDVLATTRDRYIRVGAPHPTDPAIWVQDCDATGHLTTTTGRYLQATTLANRYRLHARPTERYDR